MLPVGCLLTDSLWLVFCLRSCPEDVDMFSRSDGKLSLNTQRFIPEDATLQTSIKVVPKVGCTATWGGGVNYVGGLTGKGAARAGDGPLRVSFSFIHD
jgi:hypothetical protein